jgi:metal-responsive CopG/Arc/MetJ family transcriptional regulator
MQKRNFNIISMTLDKATVQRAKAIAKERASSVSQLVRDLVRQEWQAENDKINRQLEGA